ncbi:thiamine diphosphokinase [Romboutsia sp. 13368]|uniref:thiamine diphosphokinase n=1 Tax=Romboutsia sp. 13368 TaxID=2708053 RepID=UPI0025FD3B4F|nr:thiamine diphosphokinase [Romboutsia sp. 13368]
MKICIILNGEIKDYKYIKSIICKNNYDYIICSDGGANHTYKMNIVPDYIIGDLDSIEENIIKYYKSKNVKFDKFPTKKDETDTELSIWLANKLNAKKVDLIGALGGRIDHTIANINLLYYIRNKNIIPKIISEKEEVYIAIDEEIIIDGNKGDTISIIPIKGDAKGITLKNLEYPLENGIMDFSRPLGISNIMTKSSCNIKVNEGSIIIIKNI